MSSTASIVFLFAAFIWKWAEQGQLRYWLIAAFLSFSLASYWAWYKNRPDLRFALDRICLEYESVQPGVADGLLVWDVTLSMSVVNTDKKENAIREYELAVRCQDGRELSLGPDRTSNASIVYWSDAAQPDDSRLAQGRLKYAQVRFRFPDRTEDLSLNLKSATFHVRISDVYGVVHKLKGRLPPDTGTRNLLQIELQERFDRQPAWHGM